MIPRQTSECSHDFPGMTTRLGTREPRLKVMGIKVCQASLEHALGGNMVIAQAIVKHNGCFVMERKHLREIRYLRIDIKTTTSKTTSTVQVLLTLDQKNKLSKLKLFHRKVYSRKRLFGYHSVPNIFLKSGCVYHTDS
jgi:hypothetical protein